MHMNALTRGVRNAFRNTIRTFSIVAILGLSVGLALTMLIARQTVQDKITSVKSSIGNTITISPAGIRGFEGGGEALTADLLTSVSETAHVTSVTQTLSDRLTADNSDLESSIEAGSLGNRSANSSGVQFVAPPDDSIRSSIGSGSSSTGSTQITRTFTPPVTVTGTNDLSRASMYGGDSVTYTSGAALDPTKDTNEAVVGKALAEKNNLAVGSTFTMYDTKITVIGIYDTGNAFSNNGVIMPLAAVQRLTSQSGAVTSATATVDSIDNVEAATAAIKTALGDKADVTNDQASADAAVEPLESVKSISTYSLIGALVAGSVIILLTMLMIVRERRREIGVMKAIGSSNTKTMLQFVSEAVTLTLLGMVVGVIIGAVGANPVTKALVKNSDSSTTQQVGIRAGGPGRTFQRIGGASFTNIRNVTASVGPEILAEAVGAAFIIAILGSALPAFLISKVRPADVMRQE